MLGSKLIISAISGLRNELLTLARGITAEAEQGLVARDLARSAA
jgi:hypothetical protein